jgi:hypothetical protein
MMRMTKTRTNGRHSKRTRRLKDLCLVNQAGWMTSTGKHVERLPAIVHLGVPLVASMLFSSDEIRVDRVMVNQEQEWQEQETQKQGNQ